MNITNFTISHYESGSLETKRLKNLDNSVETSGRCFSIIYSCWDNTRSKILCLLSRAQYALKVTKLWNLWYLWHSFFNYERCVIWELFQLQFMIEKPDALTLFSTFYDLSVSCDLFSKAEMRQFGASGNQHETVGNRQVKKWKLTFCFQLIISSSSTRQSQKKEKQRLRNFANRQPFSLPSTSPGPPALCG